jgi:hypothetical protein
MKHIRRFCFVLALIAAFTMPAFADGGETQGPTAPASGDTQGPSLIATDLADVQGPTSLTGDVQSPGLTLTGDVLSPAWTAVLGLLF